MSSKPWSIHHPAGYRSIHYIFESKALRRAVISEVQVRSIFEEAWSEIDHTVRYPNFSDNELVGHFLNIFNRLSGNADEMGSFVKDLAKSLQEQERELQVATKEKESILEEMNKTLDELSSEKGKSESYETNIQKLKSELKVLRAKDSFSASSIVSNMSNKLSSGSIEIIDGKFIRVKENY